MKQSPNLLTFSCLSLGTSCNINQLTEQFQHNDTMFHMGNEGPTFLCQDQCLQHFESIIQAKDEDENNEEKIVENEERKKEIKIKKLFLKFAQAHSLLEYTVYETNLKWESVMFFLVTSSSSINIMFTIHIYELIHLIIILSNKTLILSRFFSTMILVFHHLINIPIACS